MHPTHSRSRRALMRYASAGALLAAVARQASAQAGVDTLKIITGYAAGGTSDSLCRRLATRLAPDYAKSAIVDNRTGAGGQIAIQYVKAQPADGSTMLQTPTSMLTIYPHIYKHLPYDPVKDLTPVTVACEFDFGFVVGPAVPAEVKSLNDYLAWARANPGSATFGSPAAGSTPHFVGALLGKNAGIELRHVAYRGTQPAMADLLGGSVSAVSGPIGDITQHLPTGKIRILGVSGAQRSRFAPNVPTMVEQGMNDMVFSEWFALFLPPNAPRAQVERLNQACKTALGAKEIVDGLNTFGLEAMTSTPEELAALLKKDTARWGPIVTRVGFSADT